MLKCIEGIPLLEVHPFGVSLVFRMGMAGVRSAVMSGRRGEAGPQGEDTDTTSVIGVLQGREIVTTTTHSLRCIRDEIEAKAGRNIYVPSLANITLRRNNMFSNVEVDRASVERRLYGLHRYLDRPCQSVSSQQKAMHTHNRDEAVSRSCAF